MLHRHDDLFGPGGQIHRAADISDASFRQHPVCQIAFSRNLVRAQYGNVHVATPDHRETVHRTKKGHAGHWLQELTSGINQVNILLIILGQGAAIQDAALAVVKDHASIGDKHRNQGRNPNAQVNVAAIGQLLCYPHRHNFPSQPFLFFRH